MGVQKSILIVEDDVFLKTVLSKKLSSENFLIFQASDGEEGLRESLLKRPDIILLDIVMPKMDGLAMLKKLRQDTWGRNVTVVIMTSQNDAEKISEAMRYNVSHVIIKSDWKVDNIVQKIKTVLPL